MHNSFELSDNRRLALGQSGALGSLYDIRSDNVLPGSLLKSIQPPADCVRVLQTPKLTYNHTMKDTLEEKLQTLDISAELSASILGGFLDCSLSANYIMKKKSDTRSQYASVSYNMQTCTEVLQLESVGVQYLSLVSLQNTRATHVICGVEWGAQTVIEAKTTTTIRTENHHIGEKPPSKAAKKDPIVDESVKTPEKKEGKEGTDTDKKASDTDKKASDTDKKASDTDKKASDTDKKASDTDKNKNEDDTAKQVTNGDKKKGSSQALDASPAERQQKNDMLSIKVRDDGALGQVLKQISRVDVGANLKSDNNDHLHKTEVEFKIITDIADFSSGSLPTDQAGVLKFLQSIPSNLEKVNNGKGVPLMFHLVPINEVARLFNITRSADVVLNKLNHGHMEDVVRILDELIQNTQECTEYEAFVRAHLFCIPKAHHKATLTHLGAARSLQRDFQEKVREALKSIRFEEGDVGQLRAVLVEYEEDKPDEDIHLAIVQKYKQKSRFADETKEKGAEYLGFGDERLQNNIVSGKYEDIYVLHFSEEMRQTPAWIENWSKLFDLLHNMAPQECVIIVDRDVGTSKENKELAKPVIEQWRDGKCIVPDVVEDLKALAKECLIKCDDGAKADRTRTKKPPSSRRLVRLRCPGINCFGETRKRKWICPRCRTHVYYGFADDDLYCKCSRYPFLSATFKCSNHVHGREWTKPDTARLLEQLKCLEVSREYNILLLGATGVGKSTFINAFRNYLEFDSLGDAMTDTKPTRTVVPSYYDVEEEMKADGYLDGTESGSDPNRFKFSVGEQCDSEQFSKTGESSTRLSKIYSFAIDDLVIRLIDTPGIGDTEGRTRDKTNIRNILATLESIDRVSGVLFLLKPNERRNTEAFSYYMSELIRHLHIDASKNILFGFTNSAEANYHLGSTKAPLDAVLARLGLEGIRNDDTQFFFDSGTCEFIAKVKKYPWKTFSKRQRYEVMWQKSTEAVYRLIDKVEDLPIHEVRKTLCLNRTRDFLEGLPKPLTEFARCMKASQDNVKEHQTKLAKLDVEDKDLAQKLSKLEIRITYTERQNFPKRRVVCGHKDCDGWTACHDDCNIEAPEGIKDIAGIGECWAFRKHHLNGFSPSYSRHNPCSSCNHAPSQHMVSSYRMVEKERPLNDEEIHKCQTERSAKGDAKESLRQEEELAARYLNKVRAEEQQIYAAQVLFGTYLGAFTLAGYEDVLIKYLDSEITRAQSYRDDGRAHKLEEQRAQYNARMSELHDAIKKGQDVSLTEQDVDDAMDGLKKMDIFGKFLSKDLEAERVALVERAITAVPCREGAKSKGLMKRFWSSL
jgi:MoxR-like ATPase